MAINDPLDLLASKGFTAGIFGKHPNASNNEKPIGKLKTKKRSAFGKSPVLSPNRLIFL